MVSPSTLPTYTDITTQRGVLFVHMTPDTPSFWYVIARNALSCHSGSGCARRMPVLEWARLPPCCDIEKFSDFAF